MRTVIFILGLLFMDCLTQHWGITIISNKSDYKYLVWLFIFAVSLDIVKK
jgi:hypothetical protein